MRRKIISKIRSFWPILFMILIGRCENMTTSSPTIFDEEDGVLTIGTPWTNKANASASDDVYTTSSVQPFLASEIKTKYLLSTGYGFTIPSNATITGVRVGIEAKCGTTLKARFEEVELIIDGVRITGSDQSALEAITDSDVVYTFGSASNLWGQSPTPQAVNGGNFGASVRLGQNGGPTTVSIDHIEMTVFFKSRGGRPQSFVAGSESSQPFVAGCQKCIAFLAGSESSQPFVAGAKIIQSFVAGSESAQYK